MASDSLYIGTGNIGQPGYAGVPPAKKLTNNSRQFCR